MSMLSDLRDSRELLRNLTMREVKGKYKRTALGQLWSLANPLAMMVVYSFVFAFVIRVKVAPGDPSGLNVFLVWMMCGLLPWTFFANVVTGAMNTIVGNENLIKKVYFPRSALVFANTLAALYQHTWEMAVLAIVVLVLGVNAWLYLPLVVVTMVCLALLGTGLGMLFAVANAHFRDVQHFVGILFQLWFYASPIVYPVTYVADVSHNHGPLFGSVTILDIYNLNPFVHFAELYRTMLYDGRLPMDASTLVVLFGSVIVFMAGWAVFDKYQDRLAELL